MVTRAYYDDEEPSFRRYSGRGHGHGYPLSHDRELPPAPSPYNTGRDHHESRSGNHAADQENSRPRSRIPVACGRCRKRKIRCSGDTGTGLPCTNCKSAGNDNCQFLRVSSTEAALKNESAEFNNFEPPSAAVRLGCRMIPYGHHSYVQQAAPVVDGTYFPRSASLSGYQYAPAAKYYTMPPFEYQEDGEFVIQPSYPAMTSELLSSNFSVPNVSRAWTPGPQLAKNGSMYLEEGSSFNHGQLPYHTYPIRPTISPETKPSSLSGQTLSGSLPAPADSGNNRVLPFPAANRQGGSYLHPTSSSIPNTQGTYHSYDGVMAAPTPTRVKINSSAVSENGSILASYPAYSSSSPESLASSSQTAYSSQAMSQQSSEIYTPNNEGFHLNDTAESSYGPSSESAKRGSQSSQGGPDSSMPSLSNGNLANGHAYVPSYNSQSSYPAPPMEVHQASQSRRVSIGISAA